MNKFWKVSEHKSIEAQLNWHNGWTAWIGIRLEQRKGDHKGWVFNFDLLTLVYFEISYYDNRHASDDDDEHSVF